jgi:2-oxoglutarate dehydrogenase E1 component
MRVAQPTLPANYAHLLRLQAYARPRKPLIVFTPKSGLRRKEAVSSVSDFTSGDWQPIIPDASVPSSAAKRVLLCSGRVYWDLAAGRGKLLDDAAAGATQIVRFEQLYPLDQKAIDAVAAGWPDDAQIFWVQDEPVNQGPWSFMMRKLAPMLGGRQLSVISRPEAASPATGSHSAHAVEEDLLIRQALGLG